LPTMCFSFLCHTCLLPVFKELDAADELGRTHRPKTRVQTAARIAIAGSALIYLITALFGYLTFYGDIDNDILTSYIDYYDKSTTPSADALTVVVHVILCVSFIVTVPLINFPLRTAVEQLFFAEKEFSWIRHVVETLLAIGAVLFLAIVVPSITAVFGLIGATSSVSLVFIFPCSIYLRVEEGDWKSKHKIPAVVMLVLGCLIGVVSLFGVFYSWAKNGIH